MPTYYGSTLAVSYAELVPAFFTEGSLRAMISRCEKRGYGMRRVKRGGGNGDASKALIAFDSLPERIRTALGDPRKEESNLMRFFEVDEKAAEFYENHRFTDGSGLADKHRELYTTNASVINAIYRMKAAREQLVRSMGNQPKKIWETLLADATAFHEPLKARFGRDFSLPENPVVLKRVCERYLREGYASLISGKYRNENRLKVTANVIALLESMFSYQLHKPTYVEIYRQYDAFLYGDVEVINNETGALYNPADFEPLSEATIKNWLGKWNSQIGTLQLRRNDRQKNIGRFKPGFDFELPRFSGSLYSIDDRKPPFEYESGKRVWFYNGVDVASGAITAWVYGKTKEELIIKFYRQMVRNYCEWGLSLPFELECEASLNSSYKDTFLKEGSVFQRVNIEGNYARGKYIERINGIIRYVYEKKYEGWIARPHARRESNQDNGANKILPYDKIVDIALECVQRYNNGACPQDESKSRWDYFMQNQHPDLPPTNWRAAIRNVGYVTKTSCRAGRAALQGQSLLLGDNGEIFTGERLINLMRLAEGNDLTVYWLDDNDGALMKAYAYIGDKYVCELLPLTCQRAFLEQTEEDKRKRELMSKYVSTIEAYGRRRRTAIEAVTVFDNRRDTVSDTFRIGGNSGGDGLQGRIAPNRGFDYSDDYEVEILPAPQDDETEFEEDLNGVATTPNWMQNF